MNERIEKLISEAIKAIPDHIDFDIPDVFKEKFAELIVNACADIGERYADGNYEVRNQIMAHFGLEEPEE